MKKVFVLLSILALVSCKKTDTYPVKEKICGTVVGSRMVCVTVKQMWWVSILVDGEVKEYMTEINYQPKQKACFDK